MPAWIRKLNIVVECRILRWRLWQCPPFLFLVMGFIVILSMIATWLLAARYTEEPEIAALIVIFVTMVFLVLGNLIIAGFNRVAESNRMKSEFISLVSHQLRSPLSVFKWTLDVFSLEGERGKKIAELSDFTRMLRETTEKMIRLVNSLLEVSRIEARTFMLKKERLSLAELSRSLIKSFQRYAEASGVTLTLEGDHALPEIRGDQERIEMVMQNLIDNAIRYTPSGRKVTVRIEKNNNSLRWSVEDQGVGIPQEQQKYIFQKFFRADSALRTQTSGVGIGLYIAKAIIEASGGKIGFKSDKEKGSAFWFTLPINKH